MANRRRATQADVAQRDSTIEQAMRTMDSAAHTITFLKGQLDIATREWVRFGLASGTPQDRLFERVNLMRRGSDLPYLSRADFNLQS